jgi:hypothetical protein
MRGSVYSEYIIIYVEFSFSSSPNLNKRLLYIQREFNKKYNNKWKKKIYIILTSFTTIFISLPAPLPIFKHKNTKIKQLFRSFLENILSMVIMLFLLDYRRLGNSSTTLESPHKKRISLKKLCLN